MDQKSIGVSPRRFESCRLRNFCLSKVLKTSIIFNYMEPNRNTAEGSRGRVVKVMDQKSIGVSPRRFESCRLRNFCLSKVLKTSIIFNYIEPNRNTAEGSRGRVVKAMDQKSIGVSPRRFESCRLRNFCLSKVLKTSIIFNYMEPNRNTAEGSRGRAVKAMDQKSIGVSPRRFESCRLRNFCLSKVLKTSIIFNYMEPNRNTAEGSRGRVVKVMDQKSIGVSPRKFESCRLRNSCPFKVLKTSIIFNYIEPNRNTAGGSRGRAVKAMDQKSTGVSLGRFESCRLCAFLHFLFLPDYIFGALRPGCTKRGQL